MTYRDAGKSSSAVCLLYSMRSCIPWLFVTGKEYVHLYNHNITHHHNHMYFTSCSMRGSYILGKTVLNSEIGEDGTMVTREDAVVRQRRANPAAICRPVKHYQLLRGNDMSVE